MGDNPRCCIDFDDLCDNVLTTTLPHLERLFEIIPAARVTLFTIPARTSHATVEYIKEKYPTIQLAPHGWRHTRGECLGWTHDEALEKISLARTKGIDAPVFKAPAWLIDGDTYTACMELNYVVATHKLFRIPNTQAREYIYNSPPKGVRSIHGHLTPVAGNNIGDMLKDGRLSVHNSTFVHPQDLV